VHASIIGSLSDFSRLLAFFAAFLLYLVSVHSLFFVVLLFQTAEDDDAQANTHRIGTGVTLVCKALNVIMMVISFMAAKKAGDVFSGAVKCTDAVSATLGFTLIDSTISTCISASVTNLTIEGVLIVYTLYSFYATTAWNANDIYRQENASEVPMEKVPEPEPEEAQA